MSIHKYFISFKQKLINSCVLKKWANCHSIIVDLITANNIKKLSICQAVWLDKFFKQ